MSLKTVFLALTLLAAGTCRAAPLGVTTLPADAAGEAVTLFYPSAEPARPVRRGPFELLLAVDAPPMPGNGRLIAISHGSGGGPWVHTELAQALVDAGFTVVLPRHRGDNSLDPSSPGPDSWKLRPAEVSRAIDRAAADPRFAGLRLDRVGAFGMSAGGHTMLSLAGGEWSPERFRAHCEKHLSEDFNACAGLATGLRGNAWDGLKLWFAQRVLNWRFDDATRQCHHDPRIAAIVAGVPAAADFDPASLAAPQVALALITASADRWLHPQFHSGAVLAACKSCELLAELPGAGHGALLAPLPGPQVLSPLENTLIGDPPGYDRPAATALWVGRTVAFFRRQLLGT
jgi:predicted dienelactone hydrolase